jgi:hypothetical protein
LRSLPRIVARKKGGCSPSRLGREQPFFFGKLWREKWEE